MLLSPNRADSEEKENACTSSEELKDRTTEGGLTSKLKYHTASDKCNSPNLIQKYCTYSACLDIIKCT